MNPLIKGLLVGVTALLLIGAIVIVAVGRSAKEADDEMDTAVENAGAAHSEIWALEGEGMMFGREISESRCLIEAVARYEADTGLSNAIEQTNFIRGCLWTSRVDQDLCTEVPPDSDASTTEEWRASRCRTLGLGDAPRCPNFLKEVQSYCHGPERQKKLSST